MRRELNTELHSLHLEPFDRCHSPVVARWVPDPQQLRLLAPGTDPPLTAAKVDRWKKPGGYAFLLVENGVTDPIGYGELNPMRSERRHMWLGHIVICPQRRGRGIGQAFVRALVSHAFD